MLLVGFILRIYHDARSHERQKYFYRSLFATHKLLDCTDRRIPLFPSVTSLKIRFLQYSTILQPSTSAVSPDRSTHCHLPLMHNRTVHRYGYLVQRSKQQSGLVACNEIRANCERLRSRGGVDERANSSAILRQIHRKVEIC